MRDVFISCARSTEAQARRIGELLRGLGYGVWRTANSRYAEVIDDGLTAAKAVLVIWSAEGAKSEADQARTDRKLVQVRVDDARLPRPFDRTQSADLIGWNRDSEAAGWRKVVASITELVGPQRRP